MRFKKITAGFLAAAMAVTSMVSVGASADWNIKDGEVLDPGLQIGTGNWLAQIYNIGDPDYGRPAVDYGLDLSKVAAVRAVFTVDKDPDFGYSFFEGSVGGNIGISTLITGAEEDDYLYDKYYWPSDNMWWGLEYTNSNGKVINSDPNVDNDPDNDNKVSAKRIGNHTYELVADYVNPFVEDGVTEIDCMQVFVQQWSDTLNTYTVNCVEILDDEGNIMLSFDEHGNAETDKDPYMPSDPYTPPAPGTGDDVDDPYDPDIDPDSPIAPGYSSLVPGTGDAGVDPDDPDIEPDLPYDSGEYHAYIGFQTAGYSFRNKWTDPLYGKDTKYFDHVVVWGDNDPETFPPVADKFDYDIEGYVLDATYKDVTFDRDGTYTVSISDFDWALDQSKLFNMVFVSTDIPNSSDITISDVKLLVDGKVTREHKGTVPASLSLDYDRKTNASFNADAYYKCVDIVNTYEENMNSYNGSYPTDSLAVQFTVSGIENLDTPQFDEYGNYTIHYYDYYDDQNINLGRVKGARFEIKVDENLDAWDGEIGGAIALSFNGGDITFDEDNPLYEKYNWIQNDFHGVCDEELGIDTVDKDLPIIAEKTGDYTYTIEINGVDNPFEDKEYDVSEVGYASVTLQNWSTTKAGFTVKSCELLDEFGNVLAKYDQNKREVFAKKNKNFENWCKIIYGAYHSYDEPVEYPDLDLSAVTGARFTVYNDDPDWTGDLGGAIVFDSNGGDLFYEPDYDWVMKQFWGITDEEREIDSTATVSDSEYFVVEGEKIDDYTYVYEYNGFANPFADGYSSVDWMQIALQQWGYELEPYTVLKAELLDKNGDVLMTFDGFTMEPPTHEHIADTPVKENIKEATCASYGSYDLVTYCSECGEEISRRHIISDDPLGHNWSEWELNSDGEHERSCTRCDVVETHKVTYEPKAYVVFSDSQWFWGCWGYDDTQTGYCPNGAADITGDGTYTVCVDRTLINNEDLGTTTIDEDTGEIIDVDAIGVQVFLVEIEGLADKLGLAPYEVGEELDHGNVTISDVTVTADGKEVVTLDNSAIIWGNIDGRGNLRIELANAYGIEKDGKLVNDPGEEPWRSLIVKDKLAVTFTIKGIDEIFEHTKKDNVIEATCGADGSYEEVVYCSECGEEISRETVTVPATGKHTPAESVKENEVEATCGTDGSYEEVVYCDVCGEEISRESVTVPATGKHTYVDKVVAPTYEAEGYTEHTCSVCGDSYKDAYTAKKTVSNVTGLKIKGRAADALRLAWNKNTSADGYIIECKDGNKWTRVVKITKNTTTEYRIAKLAAGTSYSYRIRAYKMDGKTARYSGYTTISAKTKPSTVTGLKVKGRASDALRLSWTKNTSAAGYIIERKDGNEWVRVAKITKNTTTEYRIPKLKAGTSYNFRIHAYTMDGKTALYGGNTTISARTNPSTVTGLKVKGRASDALRLSWTKNTSAAGYIIERKDGNEWVRVAKITKNTTEYRIPKLKAGTSYNFRIHAYTMDGKTALYGGNTTISARTNPSAVSGLKLKSSAKDAVRLAWTKNTSADGYIIEMKSGGTWTRVGKVDKNSTVEFRKGSLKSKTSYSFRIKAYKMSGKTALYSGYTTITVKTK